MILYQNPLLKLIKYLQLLNPRLLNLIKSLIIDLAHRNGLRHDTVRALEAGVADRCRLEGLLHSGGLGLHSRTVLYAQEVAATVHQVVYHGLAE